MKCILVVNAGSSSVKFQVFALEGTEGLEQFIRGEIDGIGSRPRLRARDKHDTTLVDQTFSLDVSEKVNYSRPSIDITFESAAEVYGPALLGILLSGANADGQEGMKAIKAAMNSTGRPMKLVSASR